jgi:hypothetical protein
MSVSKQRWLTLPAALLAPFAIGLGCKYDPNPPEGAQECYEKRCPDGYVCADDGHCYTPAAAPVRPGTGGALSGSGGSTVLGTGGAGSGGVKGTGGKTGSGGATGRGGVTGYGGVTGRGGVTVMGGTTSTGGTTTPPNSGTEVTIANGQAQGAMTGFGWVALGSLDTITDPTCSSPAGPIVNGVSCDATVWSMPNAYCVSGYIPEVPSPGTTADFDANWGILLGIGSTPVSGGVLGQSFSSLTVSLTGSPSSGLRVQVHRRGDPDTSSYCANMTPGVATSFSVFNTTCWDTKGGSYLAAADVPYLDQIAVQVSSSTLSSITVKGLCITGIAFAK